MKISFLLFNILFILVLTDLKAQVDTGNVGNNKMLKKGLYKNYKEFINNAPSYTDEFSVMPVYLNKKDSSLVIAGIYKLTDSLKELHHIWGFCDGNSVFVTGSPSTFRYYWKLLGLGKYPFLVGKSKSIMTISFSDLLIDQIFKLNPKNLVLMIITEKGKFKEPDIRYMKKILAVRPALLEDFKKAADKYERFDNANVDEFESDEDYEGKLKIITEYLIKLNEVLKTNLP